MCHHNCCQDFSFSPVSPSVACISALICSSSLALLSAFLLLIRLHVTSCSFFVIFSQFAICREVPSALMMTGPISANVIFSPSLRTGTLVSLGSPAGN